jgi:hypothetical protein
VPNRAGGQEDRYLYRSWNAGLRAFRVLEFEKRVSFGRWVFIPSSLCWFQGQENGAVTSYRGAALIVPAAGVVVRYLKRRGAAVSMGQHGDDVM